jgi:hypothetical protein
MPEEINVRFRVRQGEGHSPSSLLPAELAIRTDTNWLFYGAGDQSANLFYGHNILPLERQVLSANLQLTLANKRFQFLDPDGGDWDVILPVQTIQGLVFNIRNIGTGTLRLKEGANLIGTLGIDSYNNIQSGKEGIFIFDGVNWEVTFFG